MNHLKTIAERHLPEATRHTSKRNSLSDATKEDIDLLAIQINESIYTAHTKGDYITILELFFQWLRVDPGDYIRFRKKHHYPAQVDYLSSSMKLDERFLPSDLPIAAELNSKINATSWLMVKAVIALEDEMGASLGELLNMRVKDIIMDNDRVIARLGHNGGGKTGERLILIIKSVSHVASWLNAQRFRTDPETPFGLHFLRPTATSVVAHSIQEQTNGASRQSENR